MKANEPVIARLGNPEGSAVARPARAEVSQNPEDGPIPLGAIKVSDVREMLTRIAADDPEMTQVYAEMIVGFGLGPKCSLAQPLPVSVEFKSRANQRGSDCRLIIEIVD